jgi:chemotaxis protein methyltransferase CheR
MRVRRASDLRAEVAEGLVTKETWFFRDSKLFNVLRDRILPELMERRRDERRLRIWSAGCASGQEPYSVALLIHTDFTELLDWDVRILATDVSRRMIARLSEARYDRLEVHRGLSRALLEDYFDAVDICWILRDEVRELVEPKPFNLAASFPRLPAMDLVFLRNVLPQFDEATRQEVLGKIANVLAPDGYLVLGDGETPRPLDEAFETIPDTGGFFFRRRG